MYYILIIASALFNSINFAVNKCFQKTSGSSYKSNLAFNSLLGLFTFLVFFIINGFKFKITVFSIIMAVFFNVLITAYTMLGFELMKIGSLAQYTLFLMMGGMIVPYVFGIAFLNEKFTFLRLIAIVFVLLGVIFSSSKEKEGIINTKTILLYIAVFLINGGTSIISKVHQINTGYETVGALDFVILGGIIRFIMAGVMFLSVKKDGEVGINLKSVSLIFASAALSGIAFLLQLVSASKLPATVLFPFMTGGTIILTAICGRLFFRERFTKNTIISIVFCFIGTLLFL